MEFQKRGTRRTRVKLDVDVNGSYEHILQMYDIPPAEKISLLEFETFALERLKVLKSVETIGIRHVKGTKLHKDALTEEFKILSKQGIMKALTKTKADAADRRKDHISHFILRLVYCRSDELKRWFIAQETDMFRHRFTLETAESIEKFLDISNLNYKPIPNEEKMGITNELTHSSRSESGHTVAETNYYKVPFTEVLDLVRCRRVYIQGGFAYVPHHELVVIILTKFRENLSKGLSMTSRIVPTLEEDDRLVPLLRSMNNVYFGQDYSKKPTAGAITADMIDGLSKSSFPMCMQQLQGSLKQYHHLKHWGRQQYGLFLKAIGVPLDEALRFWKSEFAKIVDGDKFDKQYAYNIRHNYGKEGKRADYTPYSCVKIITSNSPGPGDYHGCPFRHFDADLLKQRLLGQGLSREDTDQVLAKTKEGHFQIACGMVFKFKHKADVDFSTNHPNQYFEESHKIINGIMDESRTQPSQPAGTPIIVHRKKAPPKPVVADGLTQEELTQYVLDDFEEEETQ